MQKKVLEIEELVKVDSSNIDMVGYSGDTTYVQFKNGGIYCYPKTQRQEFEALSKAQSVGSHFAKTYRNKDQYAKLDNTELKAQKKPESKITVEEAMKVIIKAIKEDPDYRYGWQANIAMAFKDEYARDSNLSDAEKQNIHEVANRAANNFLDVLCLDRDD